MSVGFCPKATTGPARNRQWKYVNVKHIHGSAFPIKKMTVMRFFPCFDGNAMKILQWHVVSMVLEQAHAPPIWQVYSHVCVPYLLSASCMDLVGSNTISCPNHRVRPGLSHRSPWNTAIVRVHFITKPVYFTYKQQKCHTSCIQSQLRLETRNAIHLPSENLCPSSRAAWKPGGICLGMTCASCACCAFPKRHNGPHVQKVSRLFPSWLNENNDAYACICAGMFPTNGLNARHAWISLLQL